MARTPLYKTAETEMIRRIRDGDWAVGLRLPNEFVLAAEFGVSQGTMRRALMTLEGMGLLNRKPGRGTLVAAAAVENPSSEIPTATATAASTTAATPPARLADATGQAPGFEVYRARAGLRAADAAATALFGTARLSVLERTLRRNGARAALDEVIVPEALIPALDEDAAIDLAELLADAGLAPARIDDHVTAAVTSMGDSVALSCDRHTALLVLTRTAHDAGGTVLARQTMRLVAEGLTYGA